MTYLLTHVMPQAMKVLDAKLAAMAREDDSKWGDEEVSAAGVSETGGGGGGGDAPPSYLLLLAFLFPMTPI